MWRWFFRSRTHEPQPDTDEPRVPEAATPHPVADHLLDLQQSVGNRAVQRVVARSSEGPDRSEPSRAGGEPLPEDIRESMEDSFGADFNDVRVHTDEESATSTLKLDANAYTTGRDIYFARGKYALETPEGKRLLAHELAHVAQQGQAPAGSASGDRVSDPADATEHEAEEVAEAVERGQRVPTIASAGEGIQRDVGWAQRGPLPDPYGTLLLLNAFAAKFLDAAKLIHGNPSAIKLVNEAEAAGVQFGGYAEDGPGKAIGRAYTVGNTVYVPKSQTDPVMAMRDFLFELNNALRAPKVAELVKEAAKGTKGATTAKQHAYKRAEQEVEGMLRLGEIWLETKSTLGNDKSWDRYDRQFFMGEYQAFKDGKKTKDDVVKDVLKRVYDTGSVKGKTIEQYYIEEYERLSGGK